MIPERIWQAVEFLLMVDDSSKINIRQWRLLIAIAVLGFAFHIVWACGWLRQFGLYGFAQESEIQAISLQLSAAAADTKEVKLSLLKQTIISTRIQQCNATSKRYFTRELERVTDEYYSIERRPFDVPKCDELN